LENYRPDVVVSDVWMSGMDGHEFCKIVRDTSDALILMMSGVSSEFSVLQRKQIDADDFMIKPFDVENFLERIDSLLKQKQNAGESPLDDELHMLRMFKGLSGAQKELLLKEAGRMLKQTDGNSFPSGHICISCQ